MRQDWLSSFNLGMAMSNRGGPAIVLATIALDLGIINETFFVTLILIAIVTSLSSGAWFRYVLAKGLPLLKDRESLAQPANAIQFSNARTAANGRHAIETLGSGTEAE